MSTTQFETNSATSNVAEQNLINVSNTANKWVSSSEQHEQQLTAHIAVHTPIHTPRGTEGMQSSLPSYSSGSPQTGFHVPQNFVQSNCALTPFRQLCFETSSLVSSSNVEVEDSVTAKENSTHTENFVDQEIKNENNNNSNKTDNNFENINNFTLSNSSDINLNEFISQKRISTLSSEWSTLEQKPDWHNSLSTNVNRSKSPISSAQLKLLSPKQQQSLLTETALEISPVISTSIKNLNIENQENFNCEVNLLASSNVIENVKSDCLLESDSHTATKATGIATPQLIRNDSPYNLIHSEPEERLHSVLKNFSEEDRLIKRELKWDTNEASKILLDFAQNVATSNINNNDNQHNLSASLTNNNIEEKLNLSKKDCEKIKKIQKKTFDNDNNETNNNTQRNNRTFFRAPGLEAPNMSVISAATGCDSKMRVCPVCGFTCSSKFHYNSHMNTHGDHQCTMCNYTSRTEGRLRKHMKDSHTREQRIAAGLDDPDSLEPNKNSTSSCNLSSFSGIVPANNSKNSNSLSLRFGTEVLDNASTTMSSLADIMNRAAAAVANSSTVPSSTSTEQLLKMVDNCNSNAGTSTMTSSASFSVYSDALASLNFVNSSGNISLSNNSSGTLNSIKSLTERTNNILSSNSNLSSTINDLLGISTQSISKTSVFDNDKNFDGVDIHDPTDDDCLDDDLEEDNSNDGTNPSSSTKKSEQAPRRGGRPKKYRCKHCSYVSTSKEQSWAHNKIHIPADKQLACSKCGFVTEYKHHLEYHLNNHNGSKPFKCSKCAYTCVNKSMLNSHMKSHTPIYQYRCQDCTYQTKYCHSLKMHLEKYRHTRMPGTAEIDSDGEEKPLSEGEIDDYNSLEVDEMREEDSNCTKTYETNDSSSHSNLNSMLLQPIVNSSSMQQYTNQIIRQQQIDQMNELIRVANSNILSCSQCDYTTSSNDELMRHNMAHLIANQQQQQTPTATLVNLYQNLAAVQQQNQNLLNQQQSQQSQSHHNGNNLLVNAPEILNGILPDSSKELAVHIQQELLRARLQQQQQEEESRRQASQVAAALAASVSSGSSKSGINNSNTIVNSSLASALLSHQNNVESISDATNSLSTDHNSHNLFSESAAISNGNSTGVTQHIATSSTQFHSSTTTTSSSFGCSNDDEELHLPHSLSPVPSCGRRGSIDSESTSGGDSISKTCSVSPGSESQTPGSGSRKRKPSKINKVDQISVKLLDKCSPSVEGKRIKKFDNDDFIKNNNNNNNNINNNNNNISKTDISSLNGGDLKSGNCCEENQTNITNFFAQINQDLQRQNSMPHSCQHCMIAFSDIALYQIHLGYHGYETPFKCNRCGHLSDSSLEFNLHLYQAKHD